jgi:hypothetical protein
MPTRSKLIQFVAEMTLNVRENYRSIDSLCKSKKRQTLDYHKFTSFISVCKVKSFFIRSIYSYQSVKEIHRRNSASFLI